MRVREPGVLPSSQVFFYTPGEDIKSIFLYPLCVGLYECDNNYLVKRMNYDSFLLVYVLSGSIFVKEASHTRIVHSGEFMILDCFRPHIYGSSEGCRIIWVHFDGAGARGYYDYILRLQRANPIVASDSTAAYRYLSRLYTALSNHDPVDPSRISRYLIDMLTEFMLPPAGNESEYSSDLENARVYINENLDLPLTLEMIAAEAHLSVYHFCRSFKKAFGCSPHEYLIKVRLNAACFYLISSTRPIKDIALSCGFSSESGFCTCFRKNIGSTPAGYRQDHLYQLADFINETPG